MAKNGGKERLRPEDGEWTPPLKGDALRRFREIEKFLADAGGQSGKLRALRSALEKAGKKRGEAVLEAFEREHEAILPPSERESDPEDEDTVDLEVSEIVAAANKGVERVIEAGGDTADVEEAGKEASELVRKTMLLAANADPDGQPASLNEAENREEEGIIKKERLDFARFLGQEAGRLYAKWTGLPIEELEATGLMKMKADMAKGVKELEDIDGAPMSREQIEPKKDYLFGLLREMHQKTSELLASMKTKEAERTRQESERTQRIAENADAAKRWGVDALKWFDDVSNELGELMFDRMDGKEIDIDAYGKHLQDFFQPLKLRIDAQRREILNIMKEKNPEVLAEKMELASSAAEKLRQDIDAEDNFLSGDPFIKSKSESVEHSEDFEKKMSWLNSRGEKTLKKAKNLKILDRVRALGERYNRIPRKYKYATSAAMLAGGLGAGAIGGAVGAAALGLIGIGSVGYRALGSAASLVGIEAILQADKERKQTALNRNPKAVATGIAALMLLPVVGRLGGSAAAFITIEAALRARRERKETILNRYPRAIAAGVAALIAIGLPGMIAGKLKDLMIDHAGVEGHVSTEHAHGGVKTHGSSLGRQLASEVPERQSSGSVPAEIHSQSFENLSEWKDDVARVIEVHQGDNLWNILKQQLHDHGVTNGMTEEQQDYVISSIENKLQGSSHEKLVAMGFSSGNIDVINPGEKLDLSSVLGSKDTMGEILERAGRVGQAAAPEGVAVAESGSMSKVLEQRQMAGQHMPDVAERHSPMSKVLEQRLAAGRSTSNILEQRQMAGQHIADSVQANEIAPENAPETTGGHTDLGHAAETGDVANEAVVTKDPAARLWEMRHPGETAPNSFLKKSMELRAHGIPLENNPMFAEEALSRLEGHLKEIYGPTGSRSHDWEAWKTYSAMEVQKMPRSSFADISVPKLQDYLRELVEKTGLQPEVYGGRPESLGHFIVRAEAGSLNMDLGGSSGVDLRYAPGLYPDMESGYMPQEETSEHLDRDFVTETPPKYHVYGGFRDHSYDRRYYAGRNPAYRPMYRPWSGDMAAYANRRWWWPFGRR